MARSKCVDTGVAIATASMAGSSMSSRWLSVTLTVG